MPQVLELVVVTSFFAKIVEGLFIFSNTGDLFLKHALSIATLLHPLFILPLSHRCFFFPVPWLFQIFYNNHLHFQRLQSAIFYCTFCFCAPAASWQLDNIHSAALLAWLFLHLSRSGHRQTAAGLCQHWGWAEHHLHRGLILLFLVLLFFFVCFYCHIHQRLLISRNFVLYLWILVGLPWPFHTVLHYNINNCSSWTVQ